jgi:hypothetical protein
MYLGNEMTAAELGMQYIKYIICTFILPIASVTAVLAIDKRPIKPMAKAIIAYPLFLGSWILINIKCLIKPDTRWEKIDHVRSINIQEVSEVKEIIQ